MREPKYLSPTSLRLWEKDREEFYKNYLSDNRPEWDLQSAPAAVGSAFDAFVKCALHADLFGNDGNGVYDLRTLFESQVNNEELRTWAWEAGKYAFDCYWICGCYSELLRELEKSEEDPRFEFTLVGDVAGVPVKGKPDLWYKRGVQVVYDWKVQGYCSKHAQSPKKYYKSCRDCWGSGRAKPTRGGGDPKPHKGYKEIDYHGHKIGEHFMEEVDAGWADQIAIYSWLLGVEPGDDITVTGIDQLCCKPSPDPEADPSPLIRVAQHRCRISKGWQLELLDRLESCWAQIKTGYIFDDLSREESDARCEVLDMPQVSLGDGDEFWAEVERKEYRG